MPITAESLAPIDRLMASVAAMAGHRGAVWLLNRTSGEALAIDFYESPQDLANTSQGDLRDAIAESLEIEVTGVDEFEVVGQDRVLNKS